MEKKVATGFGIQKKGTESEKGVCTGTEWVLGREARRGNLLL